jgi:hypothetical protein
MANRVADVNAALKAAGVKERLRRGRGYYYFSGGDTSGWPSTSVYVYRAEELSVSRWLEEHAKLEQAWSTSRPTRHWWARR